jgi:putative transposase
MPQNRIPIGLKLSLEPDQETASLVDGQSRICNWLYNTLLERSVVLRKDFVTTGNSDSAKSLYTKRGLRNIVPALKEEHPFLKVVHSSPLKNTALRLSSAIQAHQKSKKGQRRGRITGWPKFRSWRIAWFSLLYDEPGKGYKIENGQLVLSLGLGLDNKRRQVCIPINDSHLLEGKEIRSLMIVKEYGRFYAVFTVWKQLPERKAVSRVIALDPNHKNLCYGVDTEGQAIEIASPSFLKVYDTRLDELKKRRDRCCKKARQVQVLDSNQKPTGKTYWEPSKRWKKYHEVLVRALKKRRDQTKTFLFTSAHLLYKRYDCIGIGDYTPHGNGITTKMRRAMNNRSLIGRFKETLSWVASKSGKTFLIYDEEGTTRTCHRCDHRVEDGLPPNIREWQCPVCKAIHVRDENSAQNGLPRVLRDLRTKGETLLSPVSGSDLVHVKERWAWRVLPSGVFCTPRGQNGGKIPQRQEIKTKA